MVFPPFSSLFGRAARNAPPRLPPGLCVYAVGDIHGHSRLLDHLLEQLRDDMAARRAAGDTVSIVFLGDYVDRGPDSRGVLDRLIALPDTLPDGCHCRFLRGNHEVAVETFLQIPASGADWLGFGGNATVENYGVPPWDGNAPLAPLAEHLDRNLPSDHRAFLQGLELTAVYGDYVFVHAGLRPGIALARQRAEDLLWIREPFLSSTQRGTHTVVHGHTVTRAVTFHPDAAAPIRIGVDTGAYASGILSAIRLRDEECVVFDTAAASLTPPPGSRATP